MQQARYLSDNRLISTAEYQTAAEQYRGLLLCPLCGEKAWFIKEVSSENINRAACFAAHHQQGCEAATLRLNTEDDTTDSNKTDKVREPSARYAPAGLWQSIKAPQLGGIDGYDVNTALRQLLSHLCRNRDFANQGQKIKVLTAAGRELIGVGDVVVFLQPLPGHGWREVFAGDIPMRVAGAHAVVRVHACIPGGHARFHRAAFRLLRDGADVGEGAGGIADPQHVGPQFHDGAVGRFAGAQLFLDALAVGDVDADHGDADGLGRFIGHP